MGPVKGYNSIKNLIGAIVLALGFVACGSEKEASRSEATQKPAPERDPSETDAAPDRSEANRFEKYTPEWYIARYKELAIQEMKRTKIPASITLAQGMLESNYGKSRLAKEGNNHFGIKCKRGIWSGDEMYLDDDEEDECFRVYESVSKSYHDHSVFLKGNYRYEDLFDFKPTNYKDWAKGLKDAGYATNPHYDRLLISLIDKNNLHYYDQFHNKPYSDDQQKGLIAKEDNQPAEQQETQKQEDQSAKKGYEHNGLAAAQLNEGQNLKQFAHQQDMPKQQLYYYNDLAHDAQPDSGMVLYLEPKADEAQKAFHVVEEGQTMWEVAHQYGIKLKSLYKMNRLDWGKYEQPQKGVKLFLRKRRYTKPKTRAVQELAQKSKAVPTTEGPSAIEMKHMHESNLHVVKRGETMTYIAELYKQDLKSLYKKNRMNYEQREQPAIGEKIHLEERRYGAPEVRDVDYDSLNQVNKQEENPMDSKLKDALAHNNYKEDNEQPEQNKNQKVGSDQQRKTKVADSVRSTQKQEEVPAKSGERNGKRADTLKATAKQGKAEKHAKGPHEPKTSANFHQVKEGETLYSIAQKYEVPMDKLMEWNDLANFNISVGQELMVSQSTKKTSPDQSIDSASETKAQGGGQGSEVDKPAYHEVKKGETLYSISTEYNIPVSTLKRINDIEKNNLALGQKLKVSKPSNQKQGSSAQNKDKTASKENSASTSDKQNANNKKQYHTVEKGDTLFSIAQKYDLEVETLKSANELSSANLSIGQKLHIPEK